MKSESKQKLKQIFEMQLITQAIDPIVMQNLTLIPLVCFPQAKNCEVCFDENKIVISLFKKNGLSGMLLKIFHNKNNSTYENNLRDSYDFWLQNIKIKPIIEIKWI